VFLTCLSICACVCAQQRHSLTSLPLTSGLLSLFIIHCLMSLVMLDFSDLHCGSNCRLQSNVGGSFTVYAFVVILAYHLYRCGPLIDLCRGPHVRHTGKIKAMQVTKVNLLQLLTSCYQRMKKNELPD